MNETTSERRPRRAAGPGPESDERYERYERYEPSIGEAADGSDAAPIDRVRPLGIHRQLSELRLTVLSVVLFVASVGAAAVALSAAFDVELYAVTADPGAVADRPFAVGFVSQLGLMLWAGTAAVAMVGAAILYAIDPWSERGRMLFVAGVLSALLAADDAFMLHEDVLPTYLFVPELTLYVVYGVLALVFLHTGRRLLRGTEYVLLVAAGAAMFISVAMDQLLPFDGRLTFIEDLAKFGGVVLWFTYIFRTTRLLATRTVNERLVQLRRR
ncbi:MAG: hypothetical protein IT196_04035 [Acidimicrobiales bacterium]|nr:hypothetical protein [Acidimicrobiales bacterium]